MPSQASLPPQPPPARPQEATLQQPQNSQQQQPPQIIGFQQNALNQQPPPSSFNMRATQLAPSFIQQQQQSFQTDPNEIRNQIGKVNEVFIF